MTEKNPEVIIYAREIRLDVVIPKSHVWEFMEEFGREFAVKFFEGGKRLKAVDGYFEHPGGWHIQLVIWEDDENRFYDFLQKFCEERKLSFRDPRPNE